jgi:TorA maturation chaperone TorD
MRDAGLERAIEAAGGMRALARALGITQPAISAWKRVPSDRVVAVESVTGVPRRDLRPELYVEASVPDQAQREIAAEDVARADEYSLIGALLWRAPTAETLAHIGGLRGDASELGVAHLMLAEAARGADADRLQREFFDLFVGVGRSELLPYGSYYRTGFLNEKPLAVVRGDMERLGLAREERVALPEDHIAILCDVMRGLVLAEFGAEGLDDRVFFERHVGPWAQRFFADLEVQATSEFYRAVGRVGRIFMEIEVGALALAA